MRRMRVTERPPLPSNEPLPEPPPYFGDDPYHVYRIFHPLRASERRVIHAWRACVVGELRALDDEAVDLIRRRRAAVDEAQEIHEELWPRLRYPNPRRPPRPDRPPLPPLAPGAMALRGVDLRRICLALLRGHGPLTLWELHAALHLAGCMVAGRRPVKVLGDAMRLEGHPGRARRVAGDAHGCRPAGTRRDRSDPGRGPGRVVAGVGRAATRQEHAGVEDAVGIEGGLDGPDSRRARRGSG